MVVDLWLCETKNQIDLKAIIIITIFYENIIIISSSNE